MASHYTHSQAAEILCLAKQYVNKSAQDNLVLAKNKHTLSVLIIQTRSPWKKKTYFTLLYYDGNTETQSQVSVFRINYCR